jgi:hypothetical protein
LPLLDRIAVDHNQKAFCQYLTSTISTAHLVITNNG